MPAPELRKHGYIEDWDPLMSNGGEWLEARLYGHEDGRRHVYLWGEGDDIRGRELGRDVTRIGFRVWPEGAQFVGMTIEKRLRGTGMAEKLIRYFLDGAEQNGTPPTETGLIHKPVIALALKRAGFVPESEDCLAELLPRSAYDTSKTPKLHMIRRNGNCDEMIDRSHGGAFFEVVPPDTVTAQYPINGPGMTVALHTRYLPPSSQAA